MRRLIQFAVAAVVVLLLGATVLLFQKVRSTSAQYTAMKASQEEAQNRYSQAINAIAEIQDSLATIDLGAPSTQLVSGQLQAEQRLTPSEGHEVMDQIAMLKASIDRAKVHIQDLETRLKHDGVKIAGLQKMVASLKRTVAEKEQLVASLSIRVDSLQTQVTGLATEVQSGQDTIRTQREELGTVYYVIGNKKDLTTKGVLIAKGGVLGMGKTLKPSGTFNEGLFTPLNTDDQTTVVIPAKKAQVVSAQPTSSYALLETPNGLELHIIDPKEFRMIKHLVIMTTT